MEENREIINFSAAFIVKDRKLLIVQAGENQMDPLKWQLPGAVLIDDEKFDDALIRYFAHLQMKEDANLEVGSIEIDTEDKILMKMFILMEGDTELDKFRDEYMDLKYAGFDEISSLELAPAESEFIKLYENEIKRYID